MDGTIAVGFFDGVHRGHQAILKGADIALTFENHPLSVLAPDRAPRLIMSWAERARAIRALGVRLTALAFDAGLAGHSPERFLELLRGLAATHGFAPSAQLSVRCGANWRFGKGGRGDAAWLVAHGVGVTVVPAVEHAGAPISSTRIRAALEAGRLEDANAMLGRPFALCGRRFAGKGKGRELGFSTLNVAPDGADGMARVQLPRGVYVVETCGVRALANYGVAPTFADRAWPRPVLEIHVPRGTGAELADFRDGETSVSFLRFVRPERVFATLEDLQRQIADDCAKIDI